MTAALRVGGTCGCHGRSQQRLTALTAAMTRRTGLVGVRDGQPAESGRLIGAAALPSSLVAWRELADALAGALEAEQGLDAVSRFVPAAWGAGMVNISLLDDDGRQLRLVTSVHTPDDVERTFATYPADAPLPATDALRTGEACIPLSARSATASCGQVTRHCSGSTSV